MTKKEKLAKIIRAITVPPLLVFLLLIILFFSKNAIFKDICELAVSIMFLALIPAAAYPLASVIPKYKDKKRDGQRDLAFKLSLVGYTAAVIYGVAVHVSRGLLIIYLSYFISAVLLTVFNKIIKLRVSGHACSITGPLILAVYFIGWKCAIWCSTLFALIFWASLTLKRHTPKELIIGSTSAVIAFTISLLFISI